MKYPIKSQIFLYVWIDFCFVFPLFTSNDSSLRSVNVVRECMSIVGYRTRAHTLPLCMCMCESVLAFSLCLNCEV